MKKTILLAFIVVMFSYCRKHNEIVVIDNTNYNLVIKGQISTDSPELIDAANVMIFSGSTYSNPSKFTMVKIEDGAFSSNVTMSTGIALVFLDADYKYIGNLYTEGLNILPLGNLSNGNRTIINLLTLNLIGNQVIPTHNPFGSQIILFTAEWESFLKTDGYFKSLAQNIDTDNDEIADFVYDKHIIVSSEFRMFIGRWGRDDTIAAVVDTSNFYINYILSVEGGSGFSLTNNDITLSGPSDSAYTDIKLFKNTLNPNSNASFNAMFVRESPPQSGSPWSTDFLPFKRGKYTLTIGGTAIHTFDYSNINAKNGLIIATPTLHTNSDGKIVSVSLIYTLPGGYLVHPENMLADLIVYFYDSPGSRYQTASLTNTTGFYSFNLGAPYDLSNLYQIEISYADLLGNKYSAIWR